MQNHTLPPLPLYPLTLCVALSLVTLTACSDRAAERSAEAPRPAYVTMVTSPTDSALEFVGEVRAIQRAELAFAVLEDEMRRLAVSLAARVAEDDA